MIDAQIVLVPYLVCPTCSETHELDGALLEDGASFGPWACDNPECTTEISGRYMTTGLKITVSPRSQRPAYHLLRGAGLWLIVKGICEPDGSAGKHTPRYYSEHTCTSNVMRSVSEVYRERVTAFGEDPEIDPHGVFTWVAHVPDSKDMAKRLNAGLEFEDVKKLFNLGDSSWRN